MRFPGFIGAAYTLDSVNADCQRCVNMYLEKIESGAGKGGEPAWLRSTPGLEEILDLGTGPIRCIYGNARGDIFVVSGNKLFLVTYDGTTWTSEERITLSTSVGIVKAETTTFTHLVFSGSRTEYITVFTTGDKKYADGYAMLYDSSDVYTGFTRETGEYATFFTDVAEKATHVAFIDGYFVFNNKDPVLSENTKFYATDVNSLAIDPLSFSSSEGDPDAIEALIANHRNLYILNETSTEVYLNSGNADFPFDRVSNGFIEKGIVAPHSLDKIEETILFLGQDKKGRGIVYSLQGLTPQRVSTHAVEQAIKSYADMTTATAYTYQSEGHSFYVLNFAEMSWCYDLSTGAWHERAYTEEDGTLSRNRVDCLYYFKDHGLHLCGDYETGKVYLLKDGVYTDNGNPITRLRTTPHVSGASLNNVFHKSLQLDLEAGVGLDGGVQGSDPQIMMTYSDDGGHTFSNEAWVSIGKKVGGIGDFKKRVIWRRLGKSRDRVYQIKFTDPNKFSLLGAEIELEVGGS